MRLRVIHRTSYCYEHPMGDGFTTLHLAPRPTPWQTVESIDLNVDPVPDEYEVTVDQFGNPVTLFAVHRPHGGLTIESVVVADITPPPPVGRGAPWEEVAAAARRATGDQAGELGPFLAHTPMTPALAGLAELTDDHFQPGRDVVSAVSGLCAGIFGGFRFDPGMTDVTTGLATVLEQRHGVCQDLAHVACAALRRLGLPARYVSGYIETVPPPGEPKLVGVDASHAWCSVWAGDLGWLDFDPTNNQMPPLRHLTVGWGRDYDDVAPVRGVVIGPPGSQRLEVSVDVSAV